MTWMLKWKSGLDENFDARESEDNDFWEENVLNE